MRVKFGNVIRNDKTLRLFQRIAAGEKEGFREGWFFADSDAYKWLEAAALSLSASPDPALENLMDTVIDEIAAAQRPDGYLNTYFTFERADQRWTNFDLHEMYCAGHLIQAAVAYFRVVDPSRAIVAVEDFRRALPAYGRAAFNPLGRHLPLPSGTATFLCTDIEGSTRLAQQYPSAWPSVRARRVRHPLYRLEVCARYIGRVESNTLTQKHAMQG